MRSLKMLCPLAMVLLCNSTFAQQAATSQPTPFGDLQMQIDALQARVGTLEAAVSNPDVEGRNYCMMVNISGLRGFASDQTEVIDALVVRRVVSFAEGTFTATLVSSFIVSVDDNGVAILSENNTTPPQLSGTFTQTGSQVDILFTDNTIGKFYVSEDGSVIHSNNVDFFGPFPNSLTLGLSRIVTMIESDTCDDFGG